jgi:hypothetical protein
MKWLSAKIVAVLRAYPLLAEVTGLCVAAVDLSQIRRK